MVWPLSGSRKQNHTLSRYAGNGQGECPRLTGCTLWVAILIGITGCLFTGRPQVQAAPAPAPSAQLIDQADLFMHYSLLGDQKLARDYGQMIVQPHPNPVTLLLAFEKAANGRHIFQILIDNQQNQSLRSVSAAIEQLLERGHSAVARNADRIKAAILAMSTSPRAFVVSRRRLMAAGEFAAPLFIHYLNQPGRHALDPYIIQMMSNIGKPLLNPLLQQLQTSDLTEKIQIVNVLGNIGYNQALPYLAQITQDPAAGADLRMAAQSAMAKIDQDGRLSQEGAAELFMGLAWGYLEQTPALRVNYPDEATNAVWYYDRGLNNVTGAMVPTPIWKDIETMRACEAALRLDPANSEAISLWLAADMLREVNLPAGASDPTHPATAKPAHYYAVAAGPVYLNSTLSIALHTHNNRLILKVISALRQTGGVHGLIGDGHGSSPLIQAMSYPDPQVRFKAAMALAAANPKHHFAGSYMVAPLLADALAQAGQPAVVLVDRHSQSRNHLAAQLKANYRIVATADLSQALPQMHKVPYLALVIITGQNAIQQIGPLGSVNPQLAYTPTVLLVPATEIAPLHTRFLAHKTIAVLPLGATASTIESAYQQILKNLGAVTPSSGEQQRDALAAAHLLQLMALNRASVYNVNAALPALHLALHSPDTELVLAVSDVLGRMPNPQAQQLLALAALSGSGAVNVRQQWFNDLAWSARNIGNHLNAAAINKLIQVVTHESDPAVQIAAAEALGALNLPSNEASVLIRRQVRF